MRSLSFTTNRQTHAVAACLLLLIAGSAFGQRLAVIAPDGAEPSETFARSLAAAISDKATVLDSSLSDAAFKAVAPRAPFNMTAAEARTVGSAIGCDLFILVRSATPRRGSFERPEYYESYAAVYVVSTRTGRLVDWLLPKFEASSPASAQKLLAESVPATAAAIAAKLPKVLQLESAESKPAALEELPADGSPEAKNFRAPIPFRRVKPEYTSTAFLFEIAATVEIEMDLDAAGTILRTEIVRWAGFGLDQSVEAAVRSMNWRPAERNGKSLPMRVLLRYNFKKFDK